MNVKVVRRTILSPTSTFSTTTLALPLNSVRQYEYDALGKKFDCIVQHTLEGHGFDMAVDWIADVRNHWAFTTGRASHPSSA